MASMFYTFVFSLLLVTAVVFADSADEEACAVIFNETIIENGCCESILVDVSKSSECGFSSEEGEPTCDDFKCLLEDDGILVDGKINEEKAKDVIDQWEDENPQEKATMDRIRNECLDGKYLKYAEGDCEPLKFFLCMYIHTILECQLWKKDAQCNAMKENVDKCKTALESK